MYYTEFVKMLFLIAGFFGIILLFSEIYQYILYMYYRNYIYKILNDILRLLDEFEYESKSDSEINYNINLIHKLLIDECEKMYKQYIIRNKFLKNVFVSPKDLFIKFIAVAKRKNENNNIKFYLLSNEQNNDEHEYEIIRQEIEKPKIKMFEKISFGVTVIGIIVTVISFFL